MRGIYVSTSALALAGMANASWRRWTYPDCDADNCYRAFINEQYTDLAPSFCLEFLASTTTDAAVIPTPFQNCDGDIRAVSSACSCITYTYTHTQTTSTPEATPTSSIPITTPVESSGPSSTPSTTPSPETSPTELPSTSEVPSTTEAPSTSEVPPTTEVPSTTDVPVTTYPATSSSSTGPESSPATSVSSPGVSTPATTEAQPSESGSGSSSYWSLTTTTVYSTTVYTVTSCAPSVADCPATTSAYLTTETLPVIVTETVYPVHTPPSSYPAWNSSNTLATSQGVAGPTATFPLGGGYGAVPTAAAVRVGFSDIAAGVAGVIAVAFL
ncbi:hypothetical protein F4802DRAFT_243107 [Xylaria palmicola]|nr:hypothetical protein F4802DRAFT_243107 [Xylaria palmicola]